MYDLKKKRYTIAMVTDWIGTAYHRELLNGFCDYCDEHDLNGHIYVTGRLNSPWESEKFRNVLLEFVKGGQMDGVVITASSLCNISGREVMEEYLSFFKSTPCVTIGSPYPGIPCISHENVKGMTLLMEHLIDHHGYKHFAFIKGSYDNQEAELRFNTFKEILEKRGLPLREDHIFTGMFRHEDGYKAALSLINNGNPEIQVLVCSSDTQAMGAMQAFRENQIAVPQQVAIAGYDDREFSSHSGFTSIRQSFWEQGILAAENCHNQILGKPVVSCCRTEPRLIVRRSCGCPFVSLTPQAPPEESLGDFQKGQVDFSLVKDSIVSVNLPEEERDILVLWLEELLHLYYLEMGGEEKEMTFSDMWARIVEWASEFPRIRGVLERVRESFMDSLLSLIPSDNPWHTYWLSIAEFTRNTLEVAVQRSLYCSKVYSENRMDSMDETGERLMSCWDQADQMNIIAETFPDFGIGECYISRYEDSRYPLGLARLILAYNSEHRYSLEPEGVQFSSSMLLPYGIGQEEKRHCYVIQTLFQGGEQLGFSVFDASSRDWRSLEMLRHKLSLSLKNSDMLKEIHGYTEKLEQKVVQRTEELQEANRKLQREIGERKKAEEELRKQEEHYRELALFLPTVILELDILLRPTFFNEAASDLLGVDDRDKFCTESLSVHIYEEDKEQAEAFLAKILKLKHPVYGEMRFLDRNNKPVTVLVHGSPIFKDDMVRGIRLSAMEIKPLLSSIVMPEELFFVHYHFSPRVKEVLLLMLQGYKTPEIGEKLFIAESTVKAHIRAIYAETGVKKRSEFFKILEEYQVNHFGYHSYLNTILTQLIKD
ncbi:MAG: substrate-binding domain-containing protein [Spirochaetales bacterium]|nr:substrate-binding domain-containing protein [Spirochaetales bacterium]